MVVTPGYPALPQELHASFRATRDLHLHGLLGEPEALGNLALRHALKFTKNEDFTASSRERINGFEQQRDFLSRADLFSHVFAFLNDAQDGGISYGIRGKNLWASKNRERNVPRRGEEVRPGTGHGRGFPSLQQSRIAFLDHVVDVTCLRETTAQPRAQVRLMGLNFFGKPAGLVRVG